MLKTGIAESIPIGGSNPLPSILARFVLKQVLGFVAQDCFVTLNNCSRGNLFRCAPVLIMQHGSSVGAFGAPVFVAAFMIADSWCLHM